MKLEGERKKGKEAVLGKLRTGKAKSGRSVFVKVLLERVNRHFNARQIYFFYEDLTGKHELDRKTATTDKTRKICYAGL